MAGSMGEEPTPANGNGSTENGSGGTLQKILQPAAGLTRHARVRAKQAVRKQVPGGSRRAFRVELSAQFLAGLYTGAVFPFVMVIARDDLKGSPQVLALLTAAPFLGNLLAMFWARAMEGRPKVPFVKWSLLAARFIVCMSVFAVGPWPFAIALSLPQIIGTISTPALASILKDVYPDDQRGRILSYTRSAVLVAQVGSTLAAGWWLHRLGTEGYRFVFPAAAVVGICAALVFSKINPNEVVEEPIPDAEGHIPTPFDKVRETARYIWGTLGILKEDKAYRWFALSVFTYGFGNLVTVPLMPVIQVNELHIHKEQLAVMANFSQIVAIGGYFFWGRFVDSRSPQVGVTLNVLINAWVPVVYILTAFNPHATAWSLLPAFILTGIVQAGIDLSYFNALLMFSGPRDVSRYQALQSFLLGIRGTLAPFIGSTAAMILQDHGQNIRWVFVGGLIMMLFGAWTQTMATRYYERKQRLLNVG